MKIVQISAVLEPDNGSDAIVYGLGDDGLVYWWNSSLAQWRHHGTPVETKETKETTDDETD